MYTFSDWLWGRYSGLFYSTAGALAFFVASIANMMFLPACLIFTFVAAVGAANFAQKRSNVLTNYPILEYFRFFFDN